MLPFTKCLLCHCLHGRVSLEKLWKDAFPSPCSWPTFSAWASSDFKLFVTVFNSSSSSAHLLMFSIRGRKGGRQARERGEKKERDGKKWKPSPRDKGAAFKEPNHQEWKCSILPWTLPSNLTRVERQDDKIQQLRKVIIWLLIGCP